MKTVLITGASGNLGKATVEKFLAEGYKVIATVLPGEVMPKANNVFTYEVDLMNELSTEKTIQQIITEHKTIEAALLLAGGFAMGNITNTDSTALQKMFALNFKTAYHVARSVFEQMKKQTQGRIVFIGARPALNPADGKNKLGYALSKSLLFKLAEFLNAEGAEHNVTASVIVPSTIDTPPNREAMPNADFTKWVKPEEIAEAMHFICSQKGNALRETVFKMYGNC